MPIQENISGKYFKNISTVLQTSPNRAGIAEPHLKIWDKVWDKNLVQNLGQQIGRDGQTNKQTDRKDQI